MFGSSHTTTPCVGEILISLRIGLGHRVLGIVVPVGITKAVAWTVSACVYLVAAVAVVGPKR